MDDKLGKRQHAVDASRNTGLTLVELLSVVAILSLLITLGVPSTQALFASRSQEGALGELRAALFLTRTEALSRYTRVRICRTLDDASCAGTSLVGQVQWTSALVFTDVDGDRVYDAATETLVEKIHFDEQAEVVWNRGDSISFNVDGTAAGANGTFTLKVDGQADCRVIVSRLGRVRHSCD